MVTWVGVEFAAVHHRDGRMFRQPGLFAFVRRAAQSEPLLLFVGETDTLAQFAGPTHPLWADALRLGMDELHIRFPIAKRLDRLQLLSRIVRREQPLLNLLEEAPEDVRTVARRMRGAA